MKTPFFLRPPYGLKKFQLADFRFRSASPSRPRPSSEPTPGSGITTDDKKAGDCHRSSQWTANGASTTGSDGHGEVVTISAATLAERGASLSPLTSGKTRSTRKASSLGIETAGDRDKSAHNGIGATTATANHSTTIQLVRPDILRLYNLFKRIWCVDYIESPRVGATLKCEKSSKKPSVLLRNEF
jgi:hypothetical protein